MKKKEKKARKKSEKKFKRGDVIVWDQTNFNKEYFDALSETDRKKYYGPLGYGSKKSKLFVFLTTISSSDGTDSGHCVLVSLDNQKIETMRHTNEFRLATDEEF